RRGPSDDAVCLGARGAPPESIQPPSLSPPARSAASGWRRNGSVSGAPAPVGTISFENGAVDLARQGWRVLPVRDKRPALKGWQRYFRHPGGYVPTARARLGPGLDIRGDGGLVVAPPTPGYEWDLLSHPVDTRVADLPRWLARLIVLEMHEAAPSEPTLNRRR